MRAVSIFATIVLLLTAVLPGEAHRLLLTTHQFDPLHGEPSLPTELRAIAPSPGSAGYYLIQLDRPVFDSQKDELNQGGVEILSYIPENAFLVRMAPEILSTVEALPYVSWVGMYHPAYKLDPAIGTHEFKLPERREDPWLRLVVYVHHPENPNLVAESVISLGGEILDVVASAHPRLIARIPPEIVQDIARLETVLYLQEQGEYFLHNNTTRWVVQTNQTGNTAIWNHGLHGENQLVAEMDSGVDYQSCFFRDTSNPIGSSHRKIQSYTTYGDGAAYDGCADGHGSHVAGTLLGNDYTATLSAYNGIAYNARLIMQDIGKDDWFSCTFGAIYPPSALTSAFQDAYNGCARIHTNSWGGQDNEYDSYAEDIDDFMWNNPEFLVHFAMGNAGPNSGTIGYPATAKNCVSVGGTQQAATQDNMYNSSSRGPTYDDRQKPTVCAPADGENGGPPDIWSVDNDASSSPTCAVVGSGWNGTSMATPAVAGCAALVRQYFMEGFYPTGSAVPADGFTPSAALLKSVLVASGVDMSGASGYPNDNEGWGRVLLENALYFVGDTRGLDLRDETAGITTGNTDSYQFSIDSSHPARFVLVWTDPSKSPPANPALVNNLNLRVTEPGGGTSYWGNNFSGGESATGGSADGLNVVEVVHRNSPTAGNWTLEVIGQNVPTGPQPYAVAVIGGGLFIPVNLESFGAVYRPDQGGVLVDWSTASEQDNLGFFVFRANALGAVYDQVNDVMIPGAGTTAACSQYSYLDSRVDAGIHYYKLQQVDSDGTIKTYGPVSVSVSIPIPDRFSLGPAVPNPFNETVELSYSIPQRTRVRIALYDVQGRMVRLLVDGEQDPAQHKTIWDGCDADGNKMSPGQYLYRMETKRFVETRKVILFR